MCASREYSESALQALQAAQARRGDHRGVVEAQRDRDCAKLKSDAAKDAVYLVRPLKFDHALRLSQRYP
jgi:hypothetical protein